MITCFIRKKKSIFDSLYRYLVYRNIPKLNSIEMAELEDLKNKYVSTFDEFFKKKENTWKSPEELATLTGSTVSQVSTVVKTFGEFVRNSKGQINTRKNYKNTTPFRQRILNVYKGKID